MKKSQKNPRKNSFPSLVSLAGLTLLLFGFLPMDILAQQEGQTLPVNDYKIGTKDLLEIRVFELPELNQTVRVAEDGSVSLALIGKVGVAGLTSQELEKNLASILDQKYTKGAHVTVFIKEYQKVAILGAVGKPGNYELVGPTTILQVISQAGGLTAEAMKEIYVFRQGPDGQKTKVIINLDDLILKGEQALNIDLQPNDVVNIPVDRILTVYVYGEVKSPGAIQFKQSQKITLLQAIAQAGGPTEWASKSRVAITRKAGGPGKEMKIYVNLKDVISGKTSNILLEEGDVIIIP
ncbi:MAG: polysaccharide biosynthesis/export family protein [Candidatus Aminicenantales bacterium]|jgi:polysaccharide export outer membrane protein